MVDVLKRGKPQEQLTHIVMCRGCDSRLRFHRKEAELVCDQRDGDYYKIKCPVCGGAVTLDAGQAETERLYAAKMELGGAG
jgi:primosomal protein N'